jgi:hypothetical protein
LKFDDSKGLVEKPGLFVSGQKMQECFTAEDAKVAKGKKD